MSYTAELASEIKLNQILLQKADRILDISPKGHLYVRKRKTKISYYHVLDNKKHVNINKDEELIEMLLNKAIAVKMKTKCKRNLVILKLQQEKYESTPQVLDFVPDKLIDAYMNHIRLKGEKWQNEKYVHPAFDLERHIHETIVDILVRSKSEVIITNLLCHYGIPFRYEERFPEPDEDGRYYYPDFTILLPDGSRLYWEHLGMLSKKKYCERTAEKLYHYQHHGVYIGKNLILTQDDNEGSCNSAFIQQVIENVILPFFEGIELKPITNMSW